jgi:hypothetical protein
VLSLVLLLTALITGLLLVTSIRAVHPGRIRPAFTRHLLDDQGEHYWDGRAWQPIVSRYSPPTRRTVAPPGQQRAAWTTSDQLNRPR